MISFFITKKINSLEERISKSTKKESGIINSEIFDVMPVLKSVRFNHKIYKTYTSTLFGKVKSFVPGTNEYDCRVICSYLIEEVNKKIDVLKEKEPINEKEPIKNKEVLFNQGYKN
jgi:hypothetical protein